MYTMDELPDNDPIQLNNKTLLKVEEENREELMRDDSYSFLYPSLDDPLFNTKIAQRKEFNDTKYENPLSGETKLSGKLIAEISDKLCNADVELASHQMFVRNFLSFNTPYNGLLLYHGLGSGKTCSAISVAEEMRNYLNQLGISQRIIVVASPNVQDNFKLQLFDERKLQLVDGLWNIRSCIGNKFLSEINPMNMKGIPRDKVIAQIKQIINSSYHFVGYVEFANYVSKKSEVESDMSSKSKETIMKKKLSRLFKNRLIIIDEVHNIRMTDDNSDKKVATELMKLVKNVKHMRLLLLSATPMYNSYKEVIWLLNLLNINDGRASISVKDVFNLNGSFKTNEEGEEIGKDLLIRKATGYVSFVRGENPYTYPFRVWPDEFASKKNISKSYSPKVQMNGMAIVSGLEHLSVFICATGSVQQKGYDYIIETLKKDVGKDPKRTMPSFENMEGFGYTILQRPLEALNIVYPDIRLGKKDFDPKELVGKVGLSRITKFKETKTPIFRGEFEYKTNEYGKIFSPENIGLYSGKIHNICKSIVDSEGVILIYSQYIDGGLVPIALALESMGLRRAEYPSLFKTQQTEAIDALTFKPRSKMLAGENFSPASYVMITGDKAFSPDNVADLKRCTNLDNKNGEKVKVILISQAGSEGLDFKFIRQVHILEPWYNMNRIEQIIGRAVRTCSHKDLPFLLRNVQLFLYGSVMERPKEEAADVYVYRLAELKSVQIGLVSRVLKESAVDCILNFDQTLFTTDIMNAMVKQKLSTGKVINYAVGDKPYTSTCDYMDSCSYKCMPDIKGYDKIILDTYGESFIMLNNDKIIQRIRDAFKERFFYKKNRLIGEITAVKSYPLIEINAALNQLVEDKHEYIIDMYDRIGRLVNIGELYLFQPLELNDKNVSMYDRSVPLDYKRHSVFFEPKLSEESISTGNMIIDNMRKEYDVASTPRKADTKIKDWYTTCSNVIPMLQTNEGWDRKFLNKLLIEHIIESLRFDEMILLLNYIESAVAGQQDEFITTIKLYIKKSEVISGKARGILLKDVVDDKIIKKLVIFDSSKKQWVASTKEDDYDFAKVISTISDNLLPIKGKLNSQVGFLYYHKKDYMVFKIKDLTGSLRGDGARCDQDQSGLCKRILIRLSKKTDKTFADLSQDYLCVLTEFYLRKFDMEGVDEKRWFLNPTEAVIMNTEIKRKK